MSENIKNPKVFNIEKFTDDNLSSMEVVGATEINPELLKTQQKLYSESTLLITNESKFEENIWLVLYKLKNGILLLLTRDYLEPSTTYKVKIYYKPNQYQEVLFFLKNIKK